MARYLLVAHQTAGSPELRQHVRKLVQSDQDAEFGILVPATPVSHLFTWSEEETLEVARENRDRAADLLGSVGASVIRTSIGSRFPVNAIEDELRDAVAPYDEIVICTFPPGVSRWLKLDLLNQVRKRTGLPVTHIMARPIAREEKVLAGTGAPASVQPQGHQEPRAATSERTLPTPPPQARTGLGEETFAQLEIPYIDRDDLPEEDRDLWDRLMEGRDVANIFRLMGNNRALLEAYVEMLNALWNESGLDDQTRELAILRVALAQRSEYLWHQHVAIARELGINDDIIRSLEHWQSTELVHFDERQRTVLAYLDAVVHDKYAPPHIFDRLTRFYPMSAIVGLTLVIGFYRMTGSFAIAMRLEPEERFVGWHLY